MLLALACEHLHARRILRPSLDRLLRLIATARATAHVRIEAGLADQLAGRRAELDALLIAPAGGRSELALLRERAAWNTRYLTAAIDDVRATEPYLVSDDALAQLSPVGHAHVNPNGRYRFDTTSGLGEGRLRPLRERALSDDPAAQPTQPIPANGDKH